MKTLTAVLTGATGGIGSAMAEQLHQQGATLILVGRDSQKLNALSARLKDLKGGGKVYECEADLSKEQDRWHLITFVEQLPVTVNALINNAGVSDFSLFENQSDETIAELIQVNAVYPLMLTRLFLTYFTRRKVAAQIVNVGSTFGSIAYPGFAAYCASKFALRGATEALAREYADRDIRFRYFAPRATRTSLNSDRVVNMNSELGVTMDSPEWVAGEFIAFMKHHKPVCHLGWPEKFFVFMNRVCPGVVSNALKKSLPVIRRYAQAP